MNYNIERTDNPTSAESLAIASRLQEYNRQNGPPTLYLALALMLRDNAGEIVGGLCGRSAYDWLFIESLIVPEPLRRSGVGRTLMEQAEAVARERGCHGVWLDTFAFQALGFYQKLGFTVFGELKDHPLGISQYWLQKRLDTDAAAEPDVIS